MEDKITDLFYLTKEEQSQLEYSFTERLIYYTIYPNYFFKLLISKEDRECKCIGLFFILYFLLIYTNFTNILSILCGYDFDDKFSNQLYLDKNSPQN